MCCHPTDLVPVAHVIGDPFALPGPLCSRPVAGARLCRRRASDWPPLRC